MSSLKIEDAARVAEVEGNEIVPVSKSAEPKAVTMEQIKEYVVKAIKSITGKDFNPATDKLAISDGDGVKASDPVDVFKKVFLRIASSEESAEGFPDGVRLLITFGDEIKPLALDKLGDWIKSYLQIDDTAFSIMKIFNQIYLMSSEDAEATQMACARKNEAGNEVKYRLKFSSLVECVRRLFTKDIVDTGITLSEDTRLLMKSGTGVAAITAKMLGLFDFIKRPAAATAAQDKIAQFNSANGSSLKAELTKVDAIDANQDSTNLPSVPAVRAYVKAEAEKRGDMSGAGESADGELAVFDGETGKRLKGSGAALATSVSENPSNTKVLTEKATVDHIKELVKDVAMFSDDPQNAGSLIEMTQDGKISAVHEVEYTLVGDSLTAIPSSKAVKNYLAARVAMLEDRKVGNSEIIIAESDTVATGNGIKGSGCKIVPGPGWGASYNWPEAGNDTTVPTTKYIGDMMARLLGMNAKRGYNNSNGIAVFNKVSSGSFCVQDSEIHIGDMTVSAGTNMVPTAYSIVEYFKRKLVIGSNQGSVYLNDGAIHLDVSHIEDATPRLVLKVYWGGYWYEFSTTTRSRA